MARRDLSRPVNVFAEIILEKHANSGASRSGSPRSTSDRVREVSGTVNVARFVCADLAAYEELTSALIDDAHLGVARIVSHVALRPIRRFAGYRNRCSSASAAEKLTNRRFRCGDFRRPPNRRRSPPLPPQHVALRHRFHAQSCVLGSAMEAIDLGPI